MNLVRVNQVEDAGLLQQRDQGLKPPLPHPYYDYGYLGVEVPQAPRVARDDRRVVLHGAVGELLIAHLPHRNRRPELEQAPRDAQTVLDTLLDAVAVVVAFGLALRALDHSAWLVAIEVEQAGELVDELDARLLAEGREVLQRREVAAAHMVGGDGPGGLAAVWEVPVGSIAAGEAQGPDAGGVESRRELVTLLAHARGEAGAVELATGSEVEGREALSRWLAKADLEALRGGGGGGYDGYH